MLRSFILINVFGLILFLSGHHLLAGENSFVGPLKNIEDSKRKEVAKGNLSLEDSLLIKDIEPNSVKNQADEDNGKIIYDDDFFDLSDNLVVPEVEFKPSKPRKKEKGIRNKKSLIDKLRSKDIRWHLTNYKIKKNDNLWEIAQKYGINYRLIIKTNQITSPDRLLPGKIIKIPNRKGFFYKVKKGDTLSEISLKHEIDLKKIIKINNIRKSKIFIGEKIFLPDAIKPSKKNQAALKRGARGEKISFKWPLYGRITSNFGQRKDPFSGKKKFHCGIDLYANLGTPIRATASGRVIYSGWKGGYGRVVIIRHKKGYLSVYAHNSKNLVKVNQVVKQGKVIAYSGMTGAVTGAHLHFEIRKYLTPLNPLKLLKKS